MKKPTLHILHLPHRLDRYNSILRQSSEQGFKVKWFEGERSETRQDAARCICQGHKAIIHYARKERMPYVIIAEDDCHFVCPGALEYFMSQVPADYDLFIGIVYAGEVNPEGRVLDGMSGSMTLYICHNRFYDTILNDIPDTGHIDRECGNLAFKYKYYACPLIVCYQLNSYSDHMQRKMNYDAYLDNRKIFGRG